MKNTTLCYIEKDNKYLMLHRIKKQNDLNHDKWIGIGGKFLENESPDECLLREVYEETGLSLKKYAYRGVVTFQSNEWEGEYMHLFTSDSFSGEVKPCDEGNLEWVDKDEVENLPIWAGDKIFLKLISKPETPFFSLKLVYESERLVTAVLNGKTIQSEV